MPRLSRKRNLRGKRKSLRKNYSKSKRHVVKKRISKRKRKMRGGSNQLKDWKEALKDLISPDNRYKNYKSACEAIKEFVSRDSTPECFENLNPCDGLLQIDQVINEGKTKYSISLRWHLWDDTSKDDTSKKEYLDYLEKNTQV